VDAPERLCTTLADRYRIERELGQGGMATVYLAHDLRHERKVAIKVLRPELAAVIGAERFVREIRTVAALQHPHILGLIDSGEVEGTAYYVMPFVEGESLRDRLSREKQLPITEAVRIATEVASALDYAHRHGVIHRDIKPENTLLHDGQALVADFGIALAVSHAGGSRMTETGMSLGTPYYMSPEQAMGEREITARSDVYALGCVLYEMLTGDPPFVGSTAQAIVAKVLTEKPVPPRRMRERVPESVESAVLTALEKLPADRFASAAEFAEALEADAVGRHATVPIRHAPQLTARSRAARSAAAAAVLAVVAAGAFWAGRGLRAGAGVAPAEARRVDIVLPDSAPIEFIGEATIGVGQTALALTRDGRTLVYVGGGAGRPRLYVRHLDRYEAVPLAGTEGAFAPFLSPDGDWIGFFADNRLKKVAMNGGPVTTLADALFSNGGVWTTAGDIIYETGQGDDLLKVSSDGGRPVSLAMESAGNSCWKNIVLLPGERSLVCTNYASGHGFHFLVARSIGQPGHRVLVRHGAARAWHRGQPVPEDALIGTVVGYADGRLFYTRGDGALVAIAFDLERLETSGQPVVVTTGVRMESFTGQAQAVVAADGTLAYVPGDVTDIGVLAALDRHGHLDTLPFPATNSLGVDVAPDGSALAVVIPSLSGSVELWRYDLRSHDRRRLLTDLCASESRWTPDGRGIIVCAAGGRIVRVDPARPGSLDTVAPIAGYPASVSQDGRTVLVQSLPDDSTLTPTVSLLSLADGTAPQVLRLAGPGGAFLPAFSPDRRWAAYLGVKGGGVFVEPVPPTGEVIRISGQLDGDVPAWSPRGDEIAFASSSQLYLAGVHPGSPPRFDPPRMIAPTRFANIDGRPYAPFPDWQRFLVKMPSPEHSARSIRLVLAKAGGSQERQP
jgi:eukaryotic-like serine/threonine-protein kinase